MRLLGWFTRRGAPPADRRLREWRQAWAEAVAAPGEDGIQRLRADLDALGLAPDDIDALLPASLRRPKDAAA